MVFELLVVLEPPKGRAWQDEKVSATGTLRLEDRNRSCAIGWVVAGVHPVIGARKVSGLQAVEPKELFVALTRDKHGRPWRDCRADHVENALAKTLVFPIRPALAWLPLGLPFL